MSQKREKMKDLKNLKACPDMVPQHYLKVPLSTFIDYCVTQATILFRIQFFFYGVFITLITNSIIFPEIFCEEEQEEEPKSAGPETTMQHIGNISPTVSQQAHHSGRIEPPIVGAD